MSEGKECPRCGSEMEYFDMFSAWRSKTPVYGPGPDDYGRIRAYRCKNCGKETIVSGHEEKVKEKKRSPTLGVIMEEWPPKEKVKEGKQ
jgi:predicted RNA-binding Zn-ribbon protein involved in translation (DUF1610 family)